MWKIGWVMAVCVLLAACAAQGGPAATAQKPVLLAEYPNRVGSEQVDVYWKCDAAQSGQARVEGVVHTLRTGRVTFAEVEIIAVDARGGTLGSAMSPTKDIVIHTNEASPFAVVLATPADTARVDLVYKYQVDQVSGADPRPHFFIRNACSPTQHAFKSISQ
jgi:hypothetical protein